MKKTGLISSGGGFGGAGVVDEKVPKGVRA
jgi:hypothetical protein